MRSRVRLFVFVGLFVTAIDLGLLLALESRVALGLANLIALVVAAVVSYLANRVWTFELSSAYRWVARPWLFVLTALLAAAVDMVVLVSVAGFPGDVLDVTSTVGLVIAKFVAMGAASVVRWAAYRNILFHSMRQALATRTDRPAPPGDKRLTVVLPAYNEAERIAQSLSEMSELLVVQMPLSDFELLVVDDCSSDDTAEVAEKNGARVIRHEANQGKGGAVRTGMTAASGRSVIFTDSDLAYPPELILDFLFQLEDGWDMVVGSRRHPDSVAEVETSFLRKVGGWGVNKLTHVVLLGQFRDTQCGIKGFRSDVASSMAERLQTLGFGFDVELFIMAELDRLSLVERPVRVNNREGSSVSLFSDTLKFAQDLVKIRRLAGQGAYSNETINV